MARETVAIYENSRGKQTIIEGGVSPWREVMGRSGFGLPPVKYAEANYANGISEMISVSMLPRDITMFFWLEGYSDAERRDAYRRLKSDLFEVGKQNEWGKLRVRCSDGTWLYVNCIYAAGLDAETEVDANFHNFTLTFRASDPLLYADDEDEINLTPQAETSLKMPFMMNKGVYFKGIRSSEYSHVMNLRSYVAYPEFEIVGPASGISFENLATGKVISFKEGFTLASGEKLNIITRPLYMQVLKTGIDETVTDVTSQLAATATLRWELQNGENRIKVALAGMTEQTTCEMRYQEGFLTTW